MRQIEKKIIINAHIENIKCNIEVNNGSVLALISFDNLGYGDITAIKFNAVGYNSFGDVVEINGNRKFFLIIQDVEIKRNECVKDLRAKLPECDIRQLKLEESQICYKDGSVVSFDGTDERTVILDAYDENGNEGKKLKALKSKFGEKFKYNIAEYDFGWICSCGRFNSISASKCSLCNNSKAEQLSATSEENNDIVMQEFDKKEEERLIFIKKEEKRKKRERKKKITKIMLASITGVIVFGLIVNAFILSERKTYASEDKMRSAVQGKWTYYSGLGNGLWQIIIDGDELGQIYESGQTPSHTKEITWNPSRGTFKVGNDKYVIKKDGSIVEGNYTYKKGGSITFYSFSDTSYETMRTALKITDVKVTSNSLYTICTGTVTNNGKKTYDSVQVKGSFKDASGKVLDTDWTYAVGSEGLEPGESTTFRLSVSKNHSITDCTVKFIE